MEMMSMKNIKKENQSFESIKHMDENNMEFWYARELQAALNILQKMQKL